MRLRQLEDPHVVRTDPYDESKPVEDPTWFYGRTDFLHDLPSALRQGQHAAIFGLRKVGKTSLVKLLQDQLRQSAPAVYVDCHGYDADAAQILGAVVKGIRGELRYRGVKVNEPAGREVADLRESLLESVSAWRASQQSERFVVILDEVDKLLPERDNAEREFTAYVRLFRTLRGLVISIT